MPTNNLTNLLLYFGLLLSDSCSILLLSQSSFIVNLHIPYFITLFVSCNILLLAIMLWKYFTRCQRSMLMEIFEYLAAPCCCWLGVSMQSAGNGSVVVMYSYRCLMALYYLLLLGKVVCVNSNYQSGRCDNMNHINPVSRLVRIVRLGLLTFLPIFITTSQIIIAALAVVLLLSLVFFILKFTYQKVFHQYLCAVGVCLSLVSTLQYTLHLFFGLRYVFLGEILSIILLLFPNNYLLKILQFKYLYYGKRSVDGRGHDQSLLGVFCFIEQVLFSKMGQGDQKKYSQLEQKGHPDGNRNDIQGSQIQLQWPSYCRSQIFNYYKAIIKRYMLNRRQSHRVPTRLRDDKSYATHLDNQSYQTEMHIIKDTVLSYEQFLNVTEYKFKYSKVFACYEYYIHRSLFVPERRQRMLIAYYSKIEKEKSLSFLTSPKFKILYHIIHNRMVKQASNKAQIRFINFEKRINKLIATLDQLCLQEIAFIEYLCDYGPRKENQPFPEERIKRRCQLKHEIEAIITKCLDSQLYSYSSSFKFLYLLYSSCFCRCGDSLKIELRKLFHSPEISRTITDYEENCLMVLSGFNTGQIVHSNELFKSRFNMVLSQGSRNTIANFISTQKQRATHDAYLQNCRAQHPRDSKQKHEDLVCYVSVQRKLQRAKALMQEKMRIGCRIYYEEPQSFNYVCSLVSLQTDKSLLRVTPKQMDLLSNMGYLIETIAKSQVVQLGQKMDLVEITLEYHSEQGNSGFCLSDGQDQHSVVKSQENKTKLGNDYIVEEKVVLIEQKFREESRQSIHYEFYRQGCILVLLLMFLITKHFVANSWVSTFSTFIREDKAVLRDMEILMKKHVLMTTIQRTVAKSGFNSCGNSTTGLSDLTAFIKSQFANYLYNQTSPFNKLISRSQSPQLSSPLYVKLYSTLLIVNFHPQILFQKALDIFRSFAFQARNNTSLSPQLPPGLTFQDLSCLYLQSMYLYSNDTIFAELVASQRDYYNWASSSLVILQIVSLVVLFSCFSVLLMLFIMQYRGIIQYYGSLQHLSSNYYTQRVRDFKYIVSQMHKLQNNKITQVEFEVDLTISFLREQTLEKVKLEDFGMMSHKKKLPRQEENEERRDSATQLQYGEQPPDSFRQDDVSDLLMLPSQKMVTVSPNGFKPVNQATILSKSNNSHLPKSHLARVLLYRRYHICFIICIFVGLLVCSQYMNNMQVEKLARVDMAEKLQNELYIIIEKTIDAVHYNWQKLYEGSSGTRPIEEMALNASLEYMISSNYRDIIYKAFSQKLASDILYADVCKYASDPAYCQKYGNGLLKAGISTIIPLLLQDELQVRQSNSSRVNDYSDDICTKSQLLYFLMIPLFKNMLQESFNQVLSESVLQDLTILLSKSVLMAMLLIFLLYSKIQMYRNEKLVRQEILTLDSISALYQNNEFKPYFNKIYYS